MDAVTILFSVLSSKSVALFSSFSLFLIGLITGPLYQSISPKTDPMTKKVVSILASSWNLSYFNLSNILIDEKSITSSDFLARLLFAASLISFCLCVSILVFTRKDLQDN